MSEGVDTGSDGSDENGRREVSEDRRVQRGSAEETAHPGERGPDRDREITEDRGTPPGSDGSHEDPNEELEDHLFKIANLPRKTEE